MGELGIYTQKPQLHTQKIISFSLSRRLALVFVVWFFWHLHIQKEDCPRFSTSEAFYSAASNLNMNSEEKLVKNIF